MRVKTPKITRKKQQPAVSTSSDSHSSLIQSGRHFNSPFEMYTLLKGQVKRFNGENHQLRAFLLIFFQTLKTRVKLKKGVAITKEQLFFPSCNRFNRLTTCEDVNSN